MTVNTKQYSTSIQVNINRHTDGLPSQFLLPDTSCSAFTEKMRHSKKWENTVWSDETRKRIRFSYDKDFGIIRHGIWNNYDWYVKDFNGKK